MMDEIQINESLTKAQILTFLSKQLDCSEENVGFLFEQPSHKSAAENSIEIPDARQRLLGT